ncbi:MAG: DUF2189 domain-containing protein [Polymorphobacter sp.]|uniref:DUF2189 domain-containing protein n=1 Tax=Polymorphobacter sp. TaxID=1909290 RepID=UPI003A84AE2E
MTGQAGLAPAMIAGNLTVADLRAALAAGWQDFRAHPQFGLFFAAIYVAAALLLLSTLFTRDAAAWLVPAAAGFPLLAPFAAVGLYEVSRRRETGEPMRWGAVLGALRGRGDEQILSMGVVVFVAFGFWLIVAHSIFAIFFAEPGMSANPFVFLTSKSGLLMILTGSMAGAVMALGFYTITVMSLPMLVDRDVDFLTAIIVSIGAVRANTVMLIGWAAFIAGLLFLAMVPLFLGLFVALPVLGHATWHLYRRVVSAPAAG